MNYGRGKVKASNEELISSYKELSSMKLVAEKYGMCAQSVHERLVKLGYNNNPRFLTESEKGKIREVYISGIKRGDGKLKALSKEIGRTIPFISRYAKTEGLTTYSRDCTDKHAKSVSIRMIKWMKENEHPKGYLGYKHGEETLKIISKKSKEHWDGLTKEDRLAISHRIALSNRLKNDLPERKGVTWKGGWRNIGGIEKYYRSAWEANYARLLEYLKQKGEITNWEHEPDIFIFEPGQTKGATYTPDFKVTHNGLHEYHEVKGWMDERSINKINAFKKFYSNEKLVLIDANVYRRLSKTYKIFIPLWE
jgi:hypothetical protein